MRDARNPIRFLIIEDEEPLARAYARILRARFGDPEIDAVGTVDAARERIGERTAIGERYTGLFVDIRLPGGGLGIDAIESARALAALGVERYDTGTDVHIAVDTTTDFFWVTHVKGAPCSGQGCPKKQTRTSALAVEYGWLNCPSSPPPPGCVEGQPCPSVITPWSPPGGGPGIKAAWVPAIASAHLTPTNGQCPIPNLAPPCQRTAVYWYATYADPTPSSNRLAAVFMSFEENYGLFSDPQQISVATSEVVRSRSLEQRCCYVLGFPAPRREHAARELHGRLERSS